MNKVKAFWANRKTWQKWAIGVGGAIVLLLIITPSAEREEEPVVAAAPTTTVVIETTTTSPVTTTVAPTTTAAPTTTVAPTTTIPEDTLGLDSCTHFYNVFRDSLDGLLTDSELREKLKEVRSNGQYADSLLIRRATKDMVAAATRLDVAALTEAYELMFEACGEL
jgi:hypothetical protein